MKVPEIDSSFVYPRNARKILKTNESGSIHKFAPKQTSSIVTVVNDVEIVIIGAIL